MNYVNLSSNDLGQLAQTGDAGAVGELQRRYTDKGSRHAAKQLKLLGVSVNTDSPTPQEQTVMNITPQSGAAPVAQNPAPCINTTNQADLIAALRELQQQQLQLQAVFAAMNQRPATPQQAMFAAKNQQPQVATTSTAALTAKPQVKASIAPKAPSATAGKPLAMGQGQTVNAVYEYTNDGVRMCLIGFSMKNSDGSYTVYPFSSHPNPELAYLDEFEGPVCKTTKDARLAVQQAVNHNLGWIRMDRDGMVDNRTAPSIGKKPAPVAEPAPITSVKTLHGSADTMSRDQLKAALGYDRSSKVATKTMRAEFAALQGNATPPAVPTPAPKPAPTPNMSDLFASLKQRFNG